MTGFANWSGGTMKTRLLIAILAVAAVFTIPASAQMAAVRGKVADAAGGPIAGAVVEFTSTDTGRKYTFKTNSKGQYFSMGVLAAAYNVTVSKDGQVIGTVKGFPVTLSREENVLDFDNAHSSAAAESKLSTDDKAKREAISKENQTIQALNNMLAAARSASQAGDYGQAIAILSQATQTDPTRDLLWAQLAEAHLNAGRHASDKAAASSHFQQAAAALRKAIEIRPREGRYYNSLGEAYTRLGQTQDAVQQYQMAAQCDPSDAAKYQFNAGAVLTNAGRLDEANTAFDKAIAANPNYAEAYYQKAVNLLGKAQVDQKTGTMIAPAEVAICLNKYLELAPTGPNAEGAKALLASLGSKVETSYGSKRK
jgi:tetratricopeptide (TPR) repeat protein